jgi:aromatic ring hydroxylase
MKEVSINRLQEIAGEVMDLIGTDDIFELLDNNVGNVQAVENRLQEVMQTRTAFESIELAMYLRACNTRRDYLPTWQPLLNAAIEMATMRNEPVNDIFLGMMPRRPDPIRNTGQLTK